MVVDTSLNAMHPAVRGRNGTKLLLFLVTKVMPSNMVLTMMYHI